MSKSEAVRILYEDEWLLAVDKPAGLLMHPSPIDPRETDTLAGRIKDYLGGATPHTIHRLDRPTSGVVLIARTVEVARLLADQFSRHQVTKQYWAITRGFTPESFECDKALKEELDDLADRQARADKSAQEARTSFRRLAISEVGIPVSRYPKARFSLVSCHPHTGRKHQIRRHLKSLRYPIIGDTRYGDRHHNHWAGDRLPLKSLALRAVSIGFHHPVTQVYTVIYAGLAPAWSATLQELGWHASAEGFANALVEMNDRIETVTQPKLVWARPDSQEGVT